MGAVCGGGVEGRSLMVRMDRTVRDFVRMT